ncbi:uncharacterized protein N7483_012969 [Penicillium malachiteum]|uniref:uncharacterized protein n=1 Tax=Penicillium malachiteum TaxID=1324776 RepID=UPI00254828FF|nr:uncharacterized protein N7483_012969 [Penicillium malachiteum]KAJ5715788.1 hypothetical protein N7483_012969 [Penicillium malachiteum]
MRLRPDDLCWEQAEETSEKWLIQLLEPEFLRPIADFMITHNRGIATEFVILRKGSHNISLRLKYRNGSTVVRLSQPGTVFFPEEKVVNEVAVMRFIRDQTSVPVPFVLHSDTKEESPLGLSPFIIMEYVEHETKMYAALNTPGCPVEQRGVPNPNIDEATLEMLYGQLAGVLLQLARPSLPRIGSLSQTNEFTWQVTRRPLTMNMNELVRVGGLLRSKLPGLDTKFDTSSSYIEALAELNIQHLFYQRNDSVHSADDCRRKFIARRLFRELARDKRLTHPLLENGPFKIWCDDLRPANVLLGENMEISAGVDWEFTYSAPVEFSYMPPWWLLVEKPELWPKGLVDWTAAFDTRLETFLRAMRRCEEVAIQKDQLFKKNNDSPTICMTAGRVEISGSCTQL